MYFFWLPCSDFLNQHGSYSYSPWLQVDLALPTSNLPAKPQLKSCPLDTIVSSVQWSSQKRTAIVTANQALFLVNYITFWKQRCHRALRLYWGWECNSRWEVFENLSRRKKITWLKALVEYYNSFWIIYRVLFNKTCNE